MDITKCFGTGCCIRHKCLRYTIPDNVVQSYAEMCKGYEFGANMDFIPNEKAQAEIDKKKEKK